MDDVLKEIESELKQAEIARSQNNEGRARVCARRAAGIAIREYLTRKGLKPTTKSAYNLLDNFKEDPNLTHDVKMIADHLTLRVTEEFKLPVNVDLIEEARTLCKELLKQ